MTLNVSVRMGAVHLVSLLLFFHSPSSAESVGRVTGAVHNEFSAELAGVNIELMSPDRVLQTESSVDGSFELNSVPAGLYEMRISARGFLAQRRPIDVRDTLSVQAVSVVLKLDSVPSMDDCVPHSTLKYSQPGVTAPRLTGTIRDFSSHKLLANAKVVVHPAGDHRTAFKTKSDKTGRYTIGDLSPGYYDIRISGGPYFPLETKNVLIPKENGVSIETTISYQVIPCQ